jgi:hypothetical protein
MVFKWKAVFFSPMLNVKVAYFPPMAIILLHFTGVSGG